MILIKDTKACINKLQLFCKLLIKTHFKHLRGVKSPAQKKHS